jgi:hypothetical protein
MSVSASMVVIAFAAMYLMVLDTLYHVLGLKRLGYGDEELVEWEDKKPSAHTTFIKR